MASIAKLVVSLGVSTADFETDLKRASTASKRELAKMERQAQQLQAKWDRNFKLAGAAVVAGLAAATKSALDFEKAMKEVSTLVEGSPKEMDRLSKAVKGMSVEFGGVPTDQAKALYQIISAGADNAADQIDQMTAANKLAVGGVTDVATAANGLTTILNAYAGSGMSAQDVSDILFTTMKGGKTTIEELSTSVGNVATIAAQTGVPFDELGAAVATLTKNGLSTSQAMDGLRGVLSAVLKQSEQSTKAADDLGISFSASALAGEGLHGFLQKIADTNPTSEQLAKLFGRVEGLNAVMALGAQDGAEFNRQLGAMATAAGATDAAFSKMADSASFKAEQARAAFQLLGIEIGEKFLSKVSTFATLFVQNFQAVADVIELVVKLITIRLGIQAVRALAVAATSATGFANAMAFLGGPIGAVTLAVGGLLIAIDKLFEKKLRQLDFIKIETGLLVKQAKEYRELGKAMDDAFKSKLKTKIQDVRDQLEIVGAKIANINNRMAGGVSGHDRLKFAKDMENARLEANNLSNVLGRYLALLFDIEREEKNVTDTHATLADIIERSQPKIDRINRLWDETNAILDELIPKAHAEAVAQYEVNQSLFRAGYLIDQANRMLDELGEGMGDVATEADLMKTAIDESVRILERTFSDLWQSIIDGSGNAWDAIESGFKSLLANLAHQAITQPIILQFQQAFQYDAKGNMTGGGFGSIDWGSIGASFGKFAAVAFGSELAGGGAWATGGALVGMAAGQYFGQQLGWWLGSAGGPIGMVVGSIIGAFAGKLLGGLFTSNTQVLNIKGYAEPKFGSRDDDTLIKTLFGDTFIRTKKIDAEGISQVADAIEAFDSAFEFLDANQIEMISDALSKWGIKLKNDAIDIQTVLDSRFAVILSTFGEEIQGFVRVGEDMVTRIDRLQVADAASKFMAANPNVFGDRTLGEFLSVIDAVREKIGGDVTEAFNTVLSLLDRFVTTTAILQSYAESDPWSDYMAQVENDSDSLAQILSGMGNELFDAIAGFTGSPEELENIGLMVTAIRQGELQLLQQIDGVQKALADRMKSLREFVQGREPSQVGDITRFKQAVATFNALNKATDATEIDALSRTFDSLIRSFSPEFLASKRSEIMALVDRFDERSNVLLEEFKQQALDAAESTRMMVDNFLKTIGDPLEFIEQYTASADASLGTINENMVTREDFAAQSQMDRDAMDDVLRAGLTSINSSVGSIGPIVAAAVRTAPGVTVVVDSQGRLVTE